MKNWTGKRRSKGQVIGETGEATFKAWAAKHRLSATKPENDFGIDYFCHVFREGSTGCQHLTGAVLAAQVRSTSVKQGKQRIKLDRDDAQTALGADVPYVLIGVNVTTERVYFRFLDDNLMRKLQSFLAGNKKSLSWPLAEMASSNEAFFRQLDKICKPGHQHRLRLSRAKLDIAAMAPGSIVSTIQVDDRGVARIRMPLITSAFDVSAAVQEEATRIVFEHGRLPDDAQRFPPHRAVKALADLVNGHIVLVGPIEREVSLVVQAPGREPVTIPAGMRAIGDETGFVLRCGLYLTFSSTRRKGDEIVHEFNHGIGAGDVKTLVEVPEEVEFLKRLCAGATIGSGDGPKLPVDHWGQLQLLGPDLQRITKVMSYYSLPMDGLRLADVVTESFQIAGHVAAAFANGNALHEVFPPFVFEEPLNGSELSQANWHPCSYKVPIVLNLGKSGLTIWSSGVGAAYVSDGGQICGFRAECQTAWRFERREEPFPEIQGPQLWLYENWPGIPLGRVGMHSVTYRGRKLAFGAKIELLETDELPKAGQT